MWWFISPKIIFGRDSLDALETEIEKIGGKRIALITDPKMVELGLVDKVGVKLKKYVVEIYKDVEPEPSLDTVVKGSRFLHSFKPDLIIGIGGGSVLDAAKAMWILYERPDIPVDAINPFEYLGLRKKAKFIAIPTTSGTGSDATWAMVLTDKKEKRKLGLSSREVIADLSILDPALAKKMPPRLTSDTGMDTLTHSIEAYVSKWRNDFSIPLSIGAAKLVFSWLEKAFSNGEDMEAREHLHNAATIAGLAFGNSHVGIAHSLGHALGGIFKIPHGRAVGVMLPFVIEFNSGDEKTASLYEELSRNLGRKLPESVRELYEKIDGPLSLSELLQREDLEENLSAVVSNAENDACTLANPRDVSGKEFEELLWCAYEGKKVDF
jgi:alcohol dehydrogenase class IV